MQWPIVGSLPSLAVFGSKDPIGYFKELGNRHGGMFTAKLGDFVTVFITDYEIMKEALVKQGDKFSGRPRTPISSELRPSKDHRGQ